MAESYSTSLKITLIGDGDLAGTWGDTTNTNWNLAEQAITGVDYLSSMGDANYTLTNLNGTSDEARNQVIVIPSTTTLSATRYVYAPYVNKTYIISNQSSGGQAIYIQGIVSGTPTGSPLLIPNGVTTEIYCDGANGFFAGATGSAGNFLVNGNLSVTGNTVLAGNVTFGGSVNFMPTGAIQMWPTATAPSGFLLCNGASVSTSTYANLFSVIGYTFGGSGSAFLLPNYLDRMPIGVNSIAAAIGATGGSASTTLSVANLPSHSHSASSTSSSSSSVSDPGHSHGSSDNNFMGNFPNGGNNGRNDVRSFGFDAFSNTAAANTNISVSTTTTTNTTIGNTGSGTAATTISPYLGINFIIKT